MAMMKVTKICPHCGKSEEHEVDEQQWLDWQGGMRIQDAMPDKDAFLREWFISGACYDCISKIFNKPKPGEDWGEMLGECECCGCPVYAKDNGVCPQCGETLGSGDEEE